LISTLKGIGDQTDYEHQYARKIVFNAAESKYFSKKDIIHALKTDYDLKFLYVYY